jgi:hypothetical protein
MSENCCCAERPRDFVIIARDFVIVIDAAIPIVAADFVNQLISHQR